MVNPKLKESYRVEIIENEGVVLISEHEYFWMKGKPFFAVVPHLTGENNIDKILDLLEDELSMPEIFFVIESLKAQGHLVEFQNGMSKSVESFWNALSIETNDVLKQLTTKKVGIKTFGNINEPKEIRTILKDSGIVLVEEDEVASFYLVLTDDYDRNELANWNKKMMESKTPWLLMKPIGVVPWIGPIFNGNEECACWGCLIQRIRANRQMETYIQNMKNTTDPIVTSFSSFPSSVNIALNVASLEIAKFLVSPSENKLFNTLISLDTKSLEMEKHVIIKRPQCKDCGDEEMYRRDREPSQLIINSSPKIYRNDGGHRTTLPDVLFEKYKRHISPITGVVSSLKRLDKFGESSVIYTYGAGHNFAMMNHKGMYFMLKNLRGRSGGKGMTDMQAKLSGMCEAIERYSGVFRGDEPCIMATYDELGSKAIHPYSYLLFSEYQYTNRNQWNEEHNSDYHMVPKVFIENRKIEWTAFTELGTGEIKYIPTGYCYFGHPDIVDYFDTACDANGNAAGNTLEEAIVQGFLELVERDSVAIWWYNRIKRQEIDIDSYNIGYLTELKEYFKTIHRDLIAIDITSDTGIYTFVAISKRTDKEVEDIVLGFGAHLDPKIALLRAITEVNQFMPCVSNEDVNGETQYWFEDPEAIKWWKTATFENQPYLVPDPKLPKLKCSDFKDLSSDDLKDDMDICVKAVADLGMKTYVLDQTRPDIGLSIVKVVVPGMRHFWKRFGKGRLYDVPVKMGWRTEPCAEENLNPIGIFF